MTNEIQNSALEVTETTRRITTHITQCPCGANRFRVQEDYWHSGAIDETGVLVYNNWPHSGGLERIECADCAREFNSDEFADVEHS